MSRRTLLTAAAAAILITQPVVHMIPPLDSKDAIAQNPSLITKLALAGVAPPPDGHPQYQRMERRFFLGKSVSGDDLNSTNTYQPVPNTRQYRLYTTDRERLLSESALLFTEERHLKAAGVDDAVLKQVADARIRAGDLATAAESSPPNLLAKRELNNLLDAFALRRLLTTADMEQKFVLATLRDRLVEEEQKQPTYSATTPNGNTALAARFVQTTRYDADSGNVRVEVGIDDPSVKMALASTPRGPSAIRFTRRGADLPLIRHRVDVEETLAKAEPDQRDSLRIYEREDGSNLPAITNPGNMHVVLWSADGQSVDLTAAGAGCVVSGHGAAVYTLGSDTAAKLDVVGSGRGKAVVAVPAAGIRVRPVVGPTGIDNLLLWTPAGGMVNCRGYDKPDVTLRLLSGDGTRSIDLPLCEGDHFRYAKPEALQAAIDDACRRLSSVPPVPSPAAGRER